MRILHLSLLALSSLVIVACSDDSAEARALQAEREAIAGGEAAAPPVERRPPAGGERRLEFNPRPGWIDKGPEGMRLAQFELPAAEGDDESPVLGVFLMGGGADANLLRWAQQFEVAPGEDPLKANATVRVEERDGMRFHTLDKTGRLLSDSMGNPDPKDGQRMLGTVIESTDGSFRGEYFVKVVGPEKTIARWADSFQDLLESL